MQVDSIQLDVVGGDDTASPKTDTSVELDGFSATSSVLRADAEDVELEGMDLQLLEGTCLIDGDEYL
jgi:hypothetical protein